MKFKTMIAAAGVLCLLQACGGGGGTPKPDDKPATPAVADLSANPDYQKGLALIGKSDCLTCHKVKEASTGPAYADVAAKYASAGDTIVAHLAQKIIKGGSGVWGAVPMTPHPTISTDDAEQMVKYVLLLNK